MHAPNEILDLGLHPDHQPVVADLASRIGAGAGTGHGEVDASRISIGILGMAEGEAEALGKPGHGRRPVAREEPRPGVRVAVAEGVHAVAAFGRLRGRECSKQACDDQSLESTPHDRSLPCRVNVRGS